MVHDNPPQAYHLTNRLPPAEVAARVAASGDPILAVRLWDATYAARARQCGTFLVCRADYRELYSPPVLRRAEMEYIFGRVPGTQNPPLIDPSQYLALVDFATNAR